MGDTLVRWTLPAGTKRSDYIAVQLPHSGRYSYNLSSTTVVQVGAGKTQSESVKGTGDLDAADGQSYEYVVDPSRGVDKLTASLRLTN